jgi:hypothetical protein
MAYIADTTSPAFYGVVAFASLSSSTISDGATALFTIDVGSNSITVSAGVFTLPQGYQWTVITQLGVNQAGSRIFNLLVDGQVIATNQRISTSNSANLWATNVLTTESAPKTVQLRNNSGASVTADTSSSGLFIIGVTL